MATTKIWDVKNHIAPLLAYVARTSKTTVRRESNLTADDKLTAEILSLPFEHFTTEEKKFVSGINCTPDNALEVITEVMKGSSSLSDTAIYHGLQSFAPGEVDADTAHAIGLRLANELWGDDFPVIVATHIDRDHIQRELLTDYARQNHFRNLQYFVDEGYLGTNFDRPNFRRMEQMIENGEIGTVIVKDMSRLGRNYLQV